MMNIRDSEQNDTDIQHSIRKAKKIDVLNQRNQINGRSKTFQFYENKIFLHTF